MAGFEYKGLRKLFPGYLRRIAVHGYHSIEILRADRCRYVVTYCKFVSQGSVELGMTVAFKPLNFGSEGRGIRKIQSATERQVVTNTQIQFIADGDVLGNVCQECARSDHFLHQSFAD